MDKNSNKNFKKGNQHKTNLIENFQKEMSAKNGLVIFKNNGMDAKTALTFRRLARSEGSNVIIIKNTLAKIVLQNLQYNIDFNLLKNESIFVVNEDAIKSLNLMNLLPKEMKNSLTPVLLSDQRSFIDNKNDIKTLLQLKTQQMLYAYLVKSIQTPMIRLIQCLKIISTQ